MKTKEHAKTENENIFLRVELNSSRLVSKFFIALCIIELVTIIALL